MTSRRPRPALAAFLLARFEEGAGIVLIQPRHRWDTVMHPSGGSIHYVPTDQPDALRGLVPDLVVVEGEDELSIEQHDELEDHLDVLQLGGAQVIRR